MQLKRIGKNDLPPFFSVRKVFKPHHLVIDGFARMHCQNCGLWNRAILCPPMLYETYPQFKTLKSSRAWFNEHERVYLFVFKNDGQTPWWLSKDAERFEHIELKERVGRQLKGAEASSVRYLTKLMRRMQIANRKHDASTFIQGHCDLCGGRCPSRDNPPCTKGGLPSLEATGINVHALLRKLNIDYQWPPVDYITQVTMMVVK